MFLASSGRETLKFLVEDTLYELLIKNWTREWIEKMIPVEPLTGDDMKAYFSQQDLMDALVKSIPINLIDVAWDLFQKRKMGMHQLYYLLKTTAAMAIANLAQRMLETKGSSYKPV